MQIGWDNCPMYPLWTYLYLYRILIFNTGMFDQKKKAEASAGSFGLTLELENRIIFKLQPNKRVLTKTDHIACAVFTVNTNFIKIRKKHRSFQSVSRGGADAPRTGRGHSCAVPPVTASVRGSGSTRFAHGVAHQFFFYRLHK